MGSEAQARQALARRVDHWLAAAAADPELRAATRRLSLRLELDCGGLQRALELGPAEAGPALDCTLRLSAPADVWLEVLSEQPPPGRHSFTALTRQCPAFTVEGDEIARARSLHALERLFELAHPAQAAAPEGPNSDCDPSRIAGRYRDVTAAGERARLYYEEAGAGEPLVMLHTAGADSRQYHELLGNPRLGADWHLYAFDMPLHGRSFPPWGWNAGTYKLGMDAYRAWCLAFIEQVVQRPAVVLGCSMGAAIGVALAASGSPLVRAVIAAEAPDRSPGRLNPWLDHPGVNASAYSAAYVRGLMSPASPLWRRRLACWIYSQGGAGVYPGDLEFYSNEYDGARLAPHVDTARCPLYLLTGAYDYSATPESSRRLAAAIPGARFTLMPELGHFPMTENPPRFLEYLMPVLAELRRIGAGTGR